jgi:arylsulfatase A-like enzyme
MRTLPGFGCALALLIFSCSALAKPANVLFLLTDDLGFADISPQITPNLARLAAAGVRFERHYTEPICGPSRAEFLTGQYATRMGYNSPSRGLSPGIETLARVMNRAGYDSHYLGKWHLSLDLATQGPLAAGFRESLSFVNQWQLQSADEPAKPGYVNPYLSAGRAKAQQHPGHLTDILTDQARAIMAQASPWFIQLSYFAVHHPVAASPQYAKPGESTHTALLRQLDANVGSLVATLKQSGKFENTLIVFASDNGATDSARNSPFAGEKGSYDEGGIRTPLIFHWPAGIDGTSSVQTPVRSVDLLPTLAGVTGSNVRGHVDGTDLSPLWQGNDLAPRQLFWAAGVLSRDGQTRLFTGPWKASALFPEQSYDARGKKISAAVGTVDQLKSSYDNWYRQAIKIDLTRIRNKNTLLLSGSDTMRIPGHGGFTFAIAMAPGARQLDTLTTLVDQPSVWSVVADRGKLQLHMAGKNYPLGVLNDSGCQSLVLTGKFWHRMTPWGDQDNYKLSIYREGKLLGQIEEKGTLPTPTSPAPATVIGDESGDWILEKHLGTPTLLHAAATNSRLISAAQLHDSMCTQLERR